ncbi:MAG: cellulase family glycosylhydrolase [Bacteroidota bacterium]
MKDLISNSNIFFLLFIISCTSPTSDTIESRNEQELPQSNRFDIMRGVNISHWLSQSNRRGEERSRWFQEEDVQFIKEVGFDHIRIPIDEEQMWNEAGDKEEEAFTLLHNALSWSQKHELRAIVDLHILRSHHFNEKEKPLWVDSLAQEQFLNCWRDLSGELKNYPLDQVAYELMNEPVADDPDDWNKLVAKGVRVVRENEPFRKILIGSNRWQSTDTFDDLKLPENDPNIIVSFHFYTPMALTHYKASWVANGVYEGPVQYPGEIIDKENFEGLDAALAKVLKDAAGNYNRDSLEKLIMKPIKFAKERQLQVYCGEWGCLKTVPETAMLNWYSDVRSILENNNVAWTIWDYKGNFGIKTGKNMLPDKPLIEVLTGTAL